MKVVIIGGVAGGASCAARLRRLDEKAEIIIFEKSGYISYANCGLPYYVGGIITDKDSLTLQTPKKFWERFCIDARVNNEVIKIDSKNKTVEVLNHITNEVYKESYDKLVLSPGAEAFIPDVVGINNSKIFTLRNVEDTLKIDNYIKKNEVKKATVIGGGFVGLEMAENLANLGLEVSIVDLSSQLFNNLDEDMVSLVHKLFVDKKVKLYLNKSLNKVTEYNGKLLLELSDHSVLNSDIVILSIGIVPNTKIAIEAGIRTGIKNSIIVNEKMETSIKDIYAVGDAVEVNNFITKEKTLISLAGPANKQGRIAADNICGGNSVYKDTLGTSIIKLFNNTVATVGLNEKQVKKLGYNYEKIIISPSSHASYYPGGKVMTLKLIFNKEDKKILGAQIFGFDGVDKRIDVLATAIRVGLNVIDLKDLELAYAPPFSSAKDPINMVGFVAENIITHKVKQFHYEDLSKLSVDGSVFLLDTRTPKEYNNGHVVGFVNYPLDELRNHLDEIPKNKPIYVMCQSAVRSYIACRILMQNGYDCYNFSGGYRFYEIIVNGKLSAVNTYECGVDKKV